MKKLAITLSIILLLAIFSPCFSILAQPTYIPHQNPATAKDSPSEALLLLFYANVFDLAAISQYQDAQSLLSGVKYANIPDELRYLIDRYSTLSRQLFTTLDNLESLLDEASTLLAHYQISEVKQKLDDAEIDIRSAQLILGDIEAATHILSDKLGVFAAPAGSEISLAYERLQRILQRLRQLVSELNQLRQSLAEGYKTQAAELIPTEISLSITPTSVFVGNSITALGRLTGDGSPMANRNISLLPDSEPLITTTDLDGSYSASITLPYKYVSTMTLKAVYTPSGDDIGIYQACQSLPVAVNTSFYSTLLEVSAPETAHPGLPITINGRVSSDGGETERTIKVLLNNTQLAEEIIQGQFGFQITPPPQIPTGKHNLTVVVTPQRRYSGTSKSLTVSISMLPIQTDIQVPLLIVIPKSIKISGKVYHSLSPVQDARVSLRFRDSLTTVKTSTDGSFAATIESPLDLSLVVPQELAITVEPVEPWYDSLEIRRGVFIINPANAGLMLVVFISLGLLVFNRARISPPDQQEETVIPQTKVSELPVITPRRKHKLIGIKGRILSAYLDGLETVERVTGVSMAPHTTLREFLKATIPRLPNASKPFSELTTIVEAVLYSSHKPDENTAVRAEQLAVTIKEELESGAS